LYQVWLKLDCWFWRRRFFFNINICKWYYLLNMVFPTVAPPDPQGPWREQFWIYIVSESVHLNLTYSGSVVLEKKIFKWPHPIFAFLWLSPLWRGTGLLFEQFKIPVTQGWFIPTLIEIGLLVLEKKIKKKNQCIFTLL
jgi:hypothetical protein